MAEGGLKNGLEDWVDIGAPKKGGGFKKCGRKSAKGSKENTQNVYQQQKLLE